MVFFLDSELTGTYKPEDPVAEINKFLLIVFMLCRKGFVLGYMVGAARENGILRFDLLGLPVDRFIVIGKDVRYHSWIRLTALLKFNAFFIS